MATDQATGRDDPTTRTVYTTRDATEAPAGDAEAAPAHGARADAANGRSRRPDGPTFTGTRTLGQLTSQLIDNLSLLVEKQVELAKQEAMETVRGGLGVLKLFAPALAVALLFVIALINLLIALLALVLPLWASALT
ncbi:MAG TPA: phage holin family protein, partial [Dehalococcoidia bacterium]|nr:phage holin family protein [Dehalococcoidia bacterium]